jgi:hypothetical protein
MEMGIILRGAGVVLLVVHSLSKLSLFETDFLQLMREETE